MLRTLDSPSDGVYCSTVGFRLTGLGGGNTYHLTLVAPVVTIPNNVNHFTLAPANADLDAANKDLVLWQDGPGQDLFFDHNNSTVDGVIWVENGDLTYTGNSGTTASTRRRTPASATATWCEAWTTGRQHRRRLRGRARRVGAPTGARSSP